MNLVAETVLLEAVRQLLVADLRFDEDKVDIELDDIAPAIAGKTYLAISPHGAVPGRHSGSQIVHDTYGVRVCVLQRCGNVARDKRRSVFLQRLLGINSQLDAVSKILRNNHCLLKVANEELCKIGDSGRFIKPLVPVSIDSKPTTVAHDAYAAKNSSAGGDPIIAIKRGINFARADYIGS